MIPRTPSVLQALQIQLFMARGKMSRVLLGVQRRAGGKAPIFASI
jgi:hypothetical protein